MAYDVYEPCPCGSGKKLKFCCQAVASEMEKIVKLRENNQSRVALHQLDDLAKSHPDAPWIFIMRASIMMEGDEPGAAMDFMGELLEKQPDHMLALMLRATAELRRDGYGPAKASIHRAFQKCIGFAPQMISWLSLEVASDLENDGCHMAAREHLALAMRTAPEKQRQDIFLRLLNCDSNRDVLYPLRSVHPLAADPEGQPEDNDRKQARMLSMIGCWGPAARRFTKVAEQSGSAADWQNAGLCRAWDGNRAEAAEALQRAARAHDDFDEAVECETLGQLLKLETAGDEASINAYSLIYRLKSVSRLLTKLDQNDRVFRVEATEESTEEELPAGMFEILDRPIPDDEPQSIDDIPVVVAQLSVYDQSQTVDEVSRVVVQAVGTDEFAAAREQLEQTGDDEVGLTEESEGVKKTLNVLPKELASLHWRWRFPPRVAAIRRREFMQTKWKQIVDEAWPNSPQSALGGKSPSDAAGDPELKLPLTAAVFVLDAYCQWLGHTLDRDAVLQRLQLEPPKPIDVGPDASLQSFSVMKLMRLRFDRASDAQISSVLNRALLIHHEGWLHEVLVEAMSRPQCVENLDLDRALMSLLDICRNQNRREDAFAWIEKGKEHAQSQDDSFERLLQWELRELSVRLEDPDDPQLQPLLQHIDQRYARKLPELRQHLAQLVEAYGIDSPWAAGEAAPHEAGAGSTTPGGIWTPGDAADDLGGEKKLWLAE